MMPVTGRGINRPAEAAGARFEMNSLYEILSETGPLLLIAATVPPQIAPLTMPFS